MAQSPLWSPITRHNAWIVPLQCDRFSPAAANNTRQAGDHRVIFASPLFTTSYRLASYGWTLDPMPCSLLHPSAR
jgi:hypothetical protein